MERKKKSTAKKSAAPKIKDLDAQQRKLALLKQKRCDAIALHIVNKLIECPVEEDVFLQSLKYMNQCHYQDIVEERAISKMCGYPICGFPLPDMPKKQYHISTKSNKIYDITDRKNYCSNYCYKAGIYIKEQMLTSPLWFRDKEEIPDFHLLPKSATGVPGEEVDQGIVKLDINEEESFTSVSAFTQEAINEVADAIDDKLQIATENKETKEEKSEIDTQITTESEAQYYTNLYMPNLADILQENAKYFDSSEQTQTSKTETNKDKEEKPTTDVKQTSKTFDRTIINTKPDESISKKPKGILSKSSRIHGKSDKKKQVSFAAQNDEKFIEPGQKFKKPGSQNSEDSSRIYKNTNIIGSVREKSDIYKYENACINVSQIEYNANLKNGTNYCPFSHANKSETETNNQGESKNIQDESKESRKSRIRNSATYKSASKLAQTKLQNGDKLNFGNFKARVKKFVREWTTYDTIIFLYGEAIKDKVSQEIRSKYKEKLTATQMDEAKQKQYESICKTLNLLELADRKYDESVTGKKLRPLPRYEELKKQAETMDLRVKAFYSGCYEVYEEDAESETESVKDEEVSVDREVPAVLPLVESKDIQALRKKIFLTSLSRVIPNICQVLKQCPNSLLSDLKKMIATFELTSDNIVFKTTEWHTVGIILIKMLSIRDSDLKTVMEDDDAQKYIKTLLSQFYIELDKLEDLLLSEAEVYNLLENFMSSSN